jgi:UDP-2,4-diacetamido-2,4,6-trideoxy-beta-L-altropyranose hydrolase
MIVIRVDISYKIGIGHVKRCITLANGIVKYGSNVCFVVGESGRKYIKYFRDYSVIWIDNDIGIDEQVDAEKTINLLKERGVTRSWMVVDNYKLNYKWERCISEAGYHVAVIDDYRDRRHHADILISDIDYPFDPALNQIDKSSKTLTGKRYALIEPEYHQADSFNAKNTHLNHLLITYGGSDPTNETVKILNALRVFKNKKTFDIRHVDVIIGPANKDVDNIIKSAHNLNLNLNLNCLVHNAPESLHQFMKNADLIFTSGGNSLIEALALKKPCVVTMTADNQQMAIDQLDQEGVVCLLGSHIDLDENNIVKKLFNIFKKHNNIAKNIATRCMYDVFGADRITREMMD